MKNRENEEKMGVLLDEHCFTVALGGLAQTGGIHRRRVQRMARDGGGALARATVNARGECWLRLVERIVNPRRTLRGCVRVQS